MDGKILVDQESPKVSANGRTTEGALMNAKTMNAKTLATAAVIAAAAGAAIPAMALGGARAAGSHVVVLKHNAFTPPTVSIHRGESVRWVWEDRGVLHNVIGHGFQSRTQKQGSFTVRFTHSGTFSYMCTIHPHMRGRVIVH
jgi:plastocyanin